MTLHLVHTDSDHALLLDSGKVAAMSTENRIRVLAVNGSPKLNGVTKNAINIVFKVLREAGIECDVIDLCVGASVRGCIGCNGCYRSPAHRCIFNRS